MCKLSRGATGQQLLPRKEEPSLIIARANLPNDHHEVGFPELLFGKCGVSRSASNLLFSCSNSVVRSK